VSGARAIFLGAIAGLCLGFAGCSDTAPPPVSADQAETSLSAHIRALGPDVNAAEANRAARIALQTSARLAHEYEVTDPPLIHNSKVNLGLRPRGLCYHWADDLQAALAQEGFKSLSLHRAIANSGTPFRIEHSTVILSANGADMESGIVLDPWRRGGELFWAPVAQDRSYDWRPRAEVFAAKAAGRAETR